MTEDQDMTRTRNASVGWIARTKREWINRQFAAGFTLTEIAAHLSRVHSMPVTVRALSKAYKRVHGRGIRAAFGSENKLQPSTTQKVADFWKKSDTSAMSHLASNKELLTSLRGKKSGE